MAHDANGGHHSHNSGDRHGGRHDDDGGYFGPGSSQSSFQDHFYPGGSPRRSGMRYRRRGGWSSLGVIAVALIVIIIRAASHDSSSSTPNFASVSVPSLSSLGYMDYEGNGDKNLGTLTVKQNSEVEWLCTGCGNGPVSIQSASIVGATRIDRTSLTALTSFSLQPGTYRDVYVTAPAGGYWTFVITPSLGD